MIFWEIVKFFPRKILSINSKYLLEILISFEILLAQVNTNIKSIIIENLF